jgi:hypothetical protein
VLSTKVLPHWYQAALVRFPRAAAFHLTRYRAPQNVLTTRRVAQLLALAICIGMGLALVIANVRSWELEDAEAYWNAALRLRHGGALYVPVNPAADEMLAYRYAPWFAWLWVPLTFLPKVLVEVGWSALLVVAIGVAVAPLLRTRTVAAICLAALMGGLLVRTASTGNVHALLIAALVYGTPRRSGPIWIGVAASLKFVPLGYALVYAGRREWRRAATVVVVTAILLGPTLLYDLANYPTAAGDSLSLLSLAGPIPWVVVALMFAAAAMALARTRFAFLAASTAVLAAIPRLDLYNLTYLLVRPDARPVAEPSHRTTGHAVMSVQWLIGGAAHPRPAVATQGTLAPVMSPVTVGDVPVSGQRGR